MQHIFLSNSEKCLQIRLHTFAVYPAGNKKQKDVILH